MTYYRTTIIAALLSATAISGAYAADPIKIGVVTPLSGTYAGIGQQVKWGLELATKEVNAAGGIMGRQVELTFEDEEANPSVAVQKADKLFQVGKVERAASKLSAFSSRLTVSFLSSSAGPSSPRLHSWSIGRGWAPWCAPRRTTGTWRPRLACPFSTSMRAPLPLAWRSRDWQGSSWLRFIPCFLPWAGISS